MIKYIINKDNIKQFWEGDTNITVKMWKASEGLIGAFSDVESKVMIQKDAGIETIVQDTLPACNSKYWKLNDDSTMVVEMSDEDKDVVDVYEIYLSKKAEFQDRNFKVTILSDENLPGFKYFKENLSDVYNYALATAGIITDIDPVNLNGYGFLNQFVPGFLVDLLKDDNSGRIKVEYIETFNPKNEQWYGVDYMTSDDWNNL